MAYVTIPGGVWVPSIPHGLSNGNFFPGAFLNVGLVDADEEEAQLIGRIRLAGGPGTSKTFGTSGSALGYRIGTSATFTDDGASDPTLRVGVKKTSTIDSANGPPARATIGAAAFDVYKDLIGGTDTITASAWRTDAMASGTPFTVTDGDLIAVCWHLDKPGAGAQAVAVGQCASSSNTEFPTATLVTSGPTYTTQSSASTPNVIFTFDDGSIGWLEGGFVFSAGQATDTIGNGNIYGNIIKFPFAVKLDAIVAEIDSSLGTRNFDIGLWSDPFGTPTAMTGGTVSMDANIGGNALGRQVVPLPSLIELSANTDYLAGCKATAAASAIIRQYDVNAAIDFQANGLDANCYAVKSTAGAAAVSQNSGKRRAPIWVKIAQVDIPAGGGGGPLVGGRIIR